MTSSTEIEYNAGMPTRTPKLDMGAITGTDQINFPVLCKSIRDEAGLTQAQMAEEIGMSLTGYGDLERGRFEPGGEMLIRILAVRARTRGVNLKALFL